MTTANQQSPTFQDHFGVVGAKYLEFRPTYPTQLFDIIKDHLQGDRKLAIDIGCGNGQATVEIAKFFEKAIGFEPSEGQIKNAMPGPNIEYRQSPAEIIDLPPESVDLVTVAQAAHWFDLPVFFNETKKVLRSKGSLIIWGYGVMRITNNEKAQALHNDLYCNKVGMKYWAPPRKHIDNCYVNIIPPYNDTIRKNITFSKKMSVSNLMGYYSTWSGYNTFKKTEGDILPELKKQFLEAYNTTDENAEIIDNEFPLFIVLSRKD
eukprot:gene9378-11520_t